MQKGRYPSLEAQIQQTKKGLSTNDSAHLQVVASPYRICPIGAHVDHQGGAVLGVAIDSYTVLAFTQSPDEMVHLSSEDFEDEISFPAASVPPFANDWGRYARGAVAALHKFYPNQIKIGFNGHIAGHLLGAGLSSSASAGVAYLMTLAKVNRLSLTDAQLVELDRLIENDYLGLNNGVQDQTTIIYGRSNSIVHQDTRNRVVTAIPHAKNIDDIAWLVIFSGYTRELTSSSFNDRVAECWEAAGQLQLGASVLGDVTSGNYLEKKNSLPANLQNRAAHYFSETERVEAGREAWAAGDFKQFGLLMNASCQSSIYQYECGSEPLIKLHEIASETAGVLGSRFSGGGYGGCLVALAQRKEAEQAIDTILEKYKLAFPEKASVCFGWVAQGVDGASYLS